MKKILIGGIILIILVIAWYGLSPLLDTKKVNESIPAMNDGVEKDASISEPVPVVDTVAHPASGQVRVVKSNDKTYIRYENYKTINGPDIQVWLAQDLKGTNYINLGPLKATEGNINYEVPAGVNIDDYRYVLTWCEDFAVLFNSADISVIKK